MFTRNHLIKSLEQALVKMPIPLNISWWWNFGSLLGLNLFIQVMTGLFLAMHYSSSVDFAFSSVVHITQDVNLGWILRNLHSNGASFFFLCLYFHTLRGIFYFSYTLVYTWMVGVSILFISMGAAFLGYVLPWGQMSLWGATVITNLLSSIPYFGPSAVLWLWGGTSVSAPTLGRFFALHYLLPFIIAVLVMIHVLFLHQTGSSNPLGVKTWQSKVPFHVFHSVKDSLGFLLLTIMLISISLVSPFALGDPENFNKANPINSPIHIKPEWYYLFAYAILRAIPNKLGGVIALIFSIFMLYMLPLTFSKSFSSCSFYPLNKFLFFSFIVCIFLLTWIGSCGVEEPYIITGQILTFFYFSFFFVDFMFTCQWKNIFIYYFP